MRVESPPGHVNKWLKGGPPAVGGVLRFLGTRGGCGVSSHWGSCRNWELLQARLREPAGFRRGIEVACL